MTHNHVYDFFSRKFPDLLTENLVYFPNGRNSIRIRNASGYPHQDLVFACDSRCVEWKLETVGTYLESLKEKIKNA